ncbi:MAG TPA: threonine/serine exporter family protein [Candidatus Avacidaminococcus intestinavium]|uniref:Threonine/serine exporter family protein n=1 Tax=Candidatus Avacidaminococcus intestinavium TaxID=2840684 RepID=A0A9D1MQ54_9FIRM|nr:threonine/serine exporter family protein [Candidatus Avacidaminococcus intestinavium]
MLLSLAFSYVATVAFGVLFMAPRKVLPVIGITGMLGWFCYKVLLEYFLFSPSFSIFCGTVLLALTSEVLARIYKKPVTIFSIPGIVPLVPGIYVYQGMYFIMANEYALGMEKLLRAFLDAGAISVGILLVSGLFRILKTSASNVTPEN